MLKLRKRPDLKLTDLGNARRLVLQHDGDIRYCWRIKKWFVFDSRHWHPDEGNQIMSKAKATVRAMYREAADEKNAERRQELAKWAALSENRGKLSAMIHLAQSESGVPVMVEELDANPWLLGLPNGVIDLKTGKVRAARREDLITKQATVEYDPHAKCPTWLAFLERIFDGREHVIEFIQRAVGYSLTGDTSEHCLFFLHGSGANGKSTFLNAMRALLGDYSTQADSSTFEQRDRGGASSDIARLRGARLVVSVETEDGHRLAESLIKQLTGGDVLAARFLYSEHFEFQPAFKLFLAANHKPTIRGTDHAIWRRIRLIPFEVTIPPKEQDRRLLTKLCRELPGILNWAVEGCLAWQRGGLQPPKEVRAATRQYREEEDMLGQFIGEKCVEDKTESEPLKQLYQRYTEWCSDSGMKAESRNKFLRRLNERGFDKEKARANVLVVAGLRLLHPDERRKLPLRLVAGGKK